MRKILTLPTWQAFLLLIIPAVFPSNYFGLVFTLIWAGLLAYCTYFLGNSLNEKLPSGHDLKIKRFNFHLFFALTYLIVIFIVFRGGYEINQDNYTDYGWTIAIIIPLHLFTMYCMFYIIWFIAKAIATMEYNRIAKFDTYAGNFFFLWFFPIGIWFVQPKIRKIFSAETEGVPTTSDF